MSEAKQKWPSMIEAGVGHVGFAQAKYATFCVQAQPVLLTGHRDGRVRVWDMACEVPRLLGTAPHDMGGQGSRLQAVAVIKVPRCLIGVP